MLFSWRWSGTPLFQLLTLRGVTLLHLLSLLLVALFRLLTSGLVGILFCDSLILLFLSLLKFLALLLLLNIESFLLLLVLSVLLRIACVSRSGALQRGKVFGMDGVAAAGIVIATRGIVRTSVHFASFAGAHDSTIVKGCRPLRGSNRWLAVILRSA